MGVNTYTGRSESLGPLFDHVADHAAEHAGRLPHNGTDTSRAAAKQWRQKARGDVRRVFECIEQSARGMTCDEVETTLQLRHQTASARIRDLVLAGAVIDTGIRRKTRTGSSARVYRTTTGENP